MKFNQMNSMKSKKNEIYFFFVWLSGMRVDWIVFVAPPIKEKKLFFELPGCWLWLIAQLHTHSTLSSTPTFNQSYLIQSSLFNNIPFYTSFSFNIQ